MARVVEFVREHWQSHRWRVIAGGILASLVLLVALVHVPYVRGRVLAWALSSLRGLGVQADAARLDYNLLTLHLRLDRVVVSADGHETPFFSADAVDLDLPWSIVGGTLAIQSLEVERPRVSIVRGPDGSLNLPEPGDAEEGDATSPQPLRIDRLAIRNLDASFADAAMMLSVDGRGVTLGLDRPASGRLAGRLAMSGGVTLRARDRETTMSVLEGGVAFDGTTVSIDALRLEAPEARIELEGTIGVLMDEPRLDLRYDGRLDAARVAPWVGVTPSPTGHVVFSGTAQGALGDPVVTLALDTEKLAWSSLGGLSLAARAAWADRTVTLESLRAALAGGELVGEARVELTERGSSRVRARIRDVDVGTLARLVPGLPVRVATTADGEVALDWSGQDVTTARGSVVATLRAPAARTAALPLDGRLEVAIARRAWRLVVDQRVADTIALRGDTAGRFLSDTIQSSSIGGRVTLDVPSVPEALRRLRAAGVDLDDRLAGRIRGDVSADLRLAGTIASPAATGQVEVGDLWLDETGPGLAQAGISATLQAIAIDPLRFTIGPNILAGRVTIGLEGNTLSGNLTGEVPRLAPLAAALPSEYRPEGAAQFTAQLDGTLDNPDVRLNLSSRDLNVAGQAVRTLQSRVRFANRVVLVDQLDLTQDEGRLSARGRYRLTDGRYAFDVEGDGLSIAPLILAEADGGAEGAGTVPLAARFDLRLSGEGTLKDPRAGGFLQFSHLDWRQYRLGAARADVLVEQGRVRLAVGVPSVNTTIRGEMALHAPRSFAFEAAAIDARLSELVRPTGPGGTAASAAPGAFDPASVAGTLSLRAHGSGRLDDLTAATVNLDLRLANVAVNGARLQLQRPARLRYAAGEVIADDLALRIGDASMLTAQGAIGGSRSTGAGLTLALTGSLADFVPFARLAPAAETIDATGGIDLRVRASGSLDAPTVAASVSLEAATVSVGSLPPIDGIGLKVAYDEGLLEVHDLRAGWQGATLTATGRMPAALLADVLPDAYLKTLPARGRTARMTARIDAITPEMLGPFLDQQTVEQIAGRVDARVEAEAETLAFEGVRADLALSRAEIEVARVPLVQTQPTRLRLSGGRLDVTAWSWAGAGNRLDLAGFVNLGGETPTLGLGVTGALDLRMLGAFAPGMATAGLASLDVKASGALSDPRIQGQVTVADASVVLREPRFAITDLSGVVTLTDGQARLHDFTANANGGTLAVTGVVEYPGFQLAGGRLTIAGRGLAFEIPQDLRTEVNADLEFALAADAPSLTGRVTIVRGSYREPVSLAGQLLSGVQSVPAVAPDEAEPTFVDRIRLGIAVVSEEGVVVDNNYGRLELGANLKVIGTLGSPVLAGRLTAPEGGEAFLGGQTYRVRRGTVDFVNATRVEPDVDLALETRVQRYDITLEVTGTPDTLEVSLRSPGLSQDDVVSLLLTGQLAEESTLAQTDLARGQLLMLLSGELLGFAGRAVGLDSVQLGRGLGGAASDFDLLATGSDPSTRLTLSKNLRRDVEIVFSQDLRQTGAITWIVIHRPFRNIEFRATSEDDTSRAYEFRHELRFGRGVAPARQGDRRRQQARERVGGVTFSGAPGFGEAELRGSVRMKSGDRFDFHRWQEDQDRLAAFYHEREFLEARVAARRHVTDEPDGRRSVALEYRIDRGPRTVLTVEGFAVADDLIDRMIVEWSRAVFDGFLLEDLRRMARRAMVERDYLQASVSASVTSPSGAHTKAVTVQITPGPRFTDRGVDFSGNERVSTTALQAAIRAGGLEVAGWLNPADLKNGLEQYYRSLGSLDAKVTVGRPEFDGQRARLPVRVDEGQPFRVASVRVEGAAAKPEAEVRKSFGLTADSAYVPSAVEPARREVEVGYLRDGFNDVRVSATTLVDRERSVVDISLAIHEGRQQVLTGIDIRGADVTSRGTVERALDLQTGQPLSLTDTYRAQKRLYGTGAFQSADVTIEPVESASVRPEGHTEPVRALVDLQELQTYRFRYGFRMNDEVGPVEVGRQVRPALVADLLRLNLFGRGISAGVAGQLEKDRRLARGLVSVPGLFGLPVKTNLFLTGSREKFPSDDLVEDKAELTAEQRFRPTRAMAVSYGYSFARTHAFDPGLPSRDRTVSVARLTSAYAWDTRDDPSNARRGWFHSSGLEWGAGRLGSDLRFVRYLAQQYHFSTLSGDVVLASAFRLGAGRGFGGQDLFPSERFYAGGGTTVRGFAEDGLGERSARGDPAGGGGLLLFNQEVRFPVFKWVGGVGFVDAGNVFPRASDISLGSLEVGAGFGLRVNSPFALFRVDFGMPLTSRDREPRGRWYFAIGQTF